MNRVKVLSEDTANKIAAGEVVEGPLSVVKELVENAIDASSSSIEIEIKSGGKSLVRVSDNGTGMGRDDAVLALERHATSKISGHEDLVHINTLGFRGEAIPSIASVSRFTISTCQQDQDAGTFVKIDGGKLINVLDIGRSPGTTVDVKNLFYNVPARRKYMRTVETETSNILRTVQNYAAAFPQIRFSVIHNDKVLLLAPAANTIEDRLATVFGKKFMDQMVRVESDQGPIKINGFVSKPSLTRSNRSSQMLFVNRRPVWSIAISHAVFTGYRTLLPKGRYPVFILFLEIDPAQIDVNVHPTKREIRFQNDWKIKDAVTRAIADALKQTELAPVVEFPQTDDSSAPSIEIPRPTAFEKNLTASTEKAFTYNPVQQRNLDIAQPVDAAPQPATAASRPVAEVKIQPPITADSRMRFNFLAQLKNSYILAEDSDGLVIIDQHAAHERVLYEQYSAMLKGSRFCESQRLLVAVTIELAPSESVILADNIDTLHRVGFDIRSFGKNTFIIDAAPAYLPADAISRTIENILSYTSENRGDYKADREKTIIRSACRAAVMVNDALTPEECAILLNNLARCEIPYTCPHGRPTAIRMPIDKLEKEFNRK